LTERITPAFRHLDKHVLEIARSAWYMSEWQVMTWREATYRRGVAYTCKTKFTERTHLRRQVSENTHFPRSNALGSKPGPNPSSNRLSQILGGERFENMAHACSGEARYF
jgi:hypothetical protein